MCNPFYHQELENLQFHKFSGHLQILELVLFRSIWMNHCKASTCMVGSPWMLQPRRDPFFPNIWTLLLVIGKLWSSLLCSSWIWLVICVIFIRLKFEPVLSFLALNNAFEEISICQSRSMCSSLAGAEVCEWENTTGLRWFQKHRKKIISRNCSNISYAHGEVKRKMGNPDYDRSYFLRTKYWNQWRKHPQL